MHDETEMRPRADRAYGSARRLLVGQRLGHRPEGHLQTLTETVACADSWMALCIRLGECPPAVPAQHPGHGQGETLHIQFGDLLGCVEAKASTGQRTVMPDCGRSDYGEKCQPADECTGTENAVRDGQAGHDSAHNEDYRDEGGQHLAKSGSVASLCAQRTDRLPPP